MRDPVEISPPPSDGGSSDLSRSVARFRSVMAGPLSNPISALTLDCDVRGSFVDDSQSATESSPGPSNEQFNGLLEQTPPSELAQAEAPPVQPDFPRIAVENPQCSIGRRSTLKKVSISTLVAPLVAVGIILIAVAWGSRVEIVKEAIADFSLRFAQASVEFRERLALLTPVLRVSAGPGPKSEETLIPSLSTADTSAPPADAATTVRMLQSLQSNAAALRQDVAELKQTIQQFAAVQQQMIGELATLSELSHRSGLSSRSAPAQAHRPTRTSRAQTAPAPPPRAARQRAAPLQIIGAPADTAAEH
jgi:hypothetical protein